MYEGQSPQERTQLDCMSLLLLYNYEVVSDTLNSYHDFLNLISNYLTHNNIGFSRDTRVPCDCKNQQIMILSQKHKIRTD